jgi:hypothetical protein
MNELITVRGGARDDSSAYIISQSKSQLEALRASGTTISKESMMLGGLLPTFELYNQRGDFTLNRSRIQDSTGVVQV